jgi:hypothetical protein
MKIKDDVTHHRQGSGTAKVVVAVGYRLQQLRQFVAMQSLGQDEQALVQRAFQELTGAILPPQD